MATQEKLTFKSDLWDGFAVVTKSEINGINLFKDMYNYYKKRAQIEEEYSKNLLKLNHKTFERRDTVSSNLVSEVENLVEPSGQSINDAWITVERAAQNEGQAHATFAAAILELIVEPCKVMIKDCEDRLKKLETEGNRITSEQQQHFKNLDKARYNHQKLTKEAEASKVAVDDAAKDSKMSKEVPKLEKKLQKSQQEAEAAGVECKQLEAEVYNYLKTWNNDLMPRVMDDYEKLDTVRLTGMTTQVHKYTSLLEEVPKRVTFAIKPVLSAVSTVNVEQDIQAFIKRHCTNAKPSYTYTSPVETTTTDISSSGEYGMTSSSSGKHRKVKSFASKITTNFKRGTTVLSTSPKTSSPFITPTSSPAGSGFAKVSIFGMKLEEMMRRQEATAPTLEIPRPLLVLAHAILAQNGDKTEGVFRVPAPNSELTRLIRQFDESNFTIVDHNIKDPSYAPPSVHCLAGAFKKLLRDSPDSLIPSSMYDKAIAQETLSQEDGKAAQAMVASLPLLNRRVTMFVIRYLQEFLHPESVSQSKMNADNIAMVFAPTALRSPSDDLNMMVANAQREKSFVRLLLETKPSFAWWALPNETPPANFVSDDPTQAPRLSLDVLQSMLDTISSISPSIVPSTPPSHFTPSSNFSTPPSASPLSPSPVLQSPLSDSAILAYRNHYADNSPLHTSSLRDRSWLTDSFEDITDVTPPQTKPVAIPLSSPRSVEPLSSSSSRRSRSPPRKESSTSSIGSNSGLSLSSSSITNMEEEITKLKAAVAREMAARMAAEEEKRRLEYETERMNKERETLERSQAAHRSQIEQLQEQLEAARSDALQARIDDAAIAAVKAEAAKAKEDAIRAVAEAKERKGVEDQETQRIRGELENARAEAEAARNELERARKEATEARNEAAAVKEKEKKASEVRVEDMIVDEKLLARVRAGPTASIATHRDAIAQELVFLATRIAYAYDLVLLMELLKSLRALRQGLDVAMKGAGIEEWQIGQLARIYNSALPPITVENLPEGDLLGPHDPYSDVEKVRKMRTIALQAVQTCIELLCALVTRSILTGNTSGQTIHINNQLGILCARLHTPEQRVGYMRKEARGLVVVTDGLVGEVKNAFPHTPVDRLMDLARPIIALVKDLDSFFSWAGLEVPALEQAPLDESVSDERLRRLRAMMFMALNKVSAQAVLMRNSLETLNSTDPRVVPMLDRIHLIVEALRVSVTPPAQ